MGFPCKTCNADPCCCHYKDHKAPTTRYPCKTCCNDPCCCYAKYDKITTLGYPCKTCCNDPCCCYAKYDKARIMAVLSGAEKLSAELYIISTPCGLKVGGMEGVLACA